MIKIICSEEEKEIIIDALDEYKTCIFNENYENCDLNDQVGTCGFCLERNIKWEIKND